LHAGRTTDGERIDRERMPMALTRDFRLTIVARARRDHRFAEALLRDAIDDFLAGETAVGRSILRDLVNATVGFEKLALKVGKPSKSLHRMLGARGNPSSENFFDIVRALQRHLHVRLSVIVRAA
jgi:DNA-binding phage protein